MFEWNGNQTQEKHVHFLHVTGISDGKSIFPGESWNDQPNSLCKSFQARCSKTFWTRFCRCDISSEVHTCCNFWNRAVHCEIAFSSRETEISTEISCRVLRNKVFNPKSPILFIHVSDIELGILSVRAFLNFLTSPSSCLLISKIYWFSDRLTNYTRFHI